MDTDDEDHNPGRDSDSGVSDPSVGHNEEDIGPDADPSQ
jgi:hypothetical protein